MSKSLKCTFVIVILIAFVFLVACALKEIAPVPEEIAPADFETNSIVITPGQAVAGEGIEVTATVENIGGEGTYHATLRINGRGVETKEVLLEAGETSFISFTLVESEPGIYQVEIDGLRDTVLFTYPDFPPSQAAEKLGEQKYYLERTVTLQNKGPGTASKVTVWVALVTTRHPYQTVLSTDISPSNYEVVEDVYQNRFAVFTYKNVGVGEEVLIKATHEVVVAELDYDLSQCTGSGISWFLQSHTFEESDNADIMALSNQIAEDKADVCASARALYDWVGDNISYVVTEADKGAVGTLGSRDGDCADFSFLLTALSRAAGIPARHIGGLVYDPDVISSEEGHSRVEMYLAGIGWVPVDPTWGRFKENREQYFAYNSAQFIIATVGNPLVISQSLDLIDEIPFYLSVHRRWWFTEKELDVSFTESYEIREVE